MEKVVRKELGRNVDSVLLKMDIDTGRSELPLFFHIKKVWRYWEIEFTSLVSQCTHLSSPRRLNEQLLLSSFNETCKQSI